MYNLLPILLQTISTNPLEQLPIGTYLIIYFIGLLITGGVGAAALYVALRKTPFDIKKIGAETKINETDYAKNLQDIAGGATTENLQLRTEKRNLENELDSLRDEFNIFKETHENDLNNLAAKYDEEISSLKIQYTKEMSDLREAHAIEMEAIKKSLQLAQDESKKWRDYSTRLISQMHAEMPDLVPVPFEPRKQIKTDE